MRPRAGGAVPRLLPETFPSGYPFQVQGPMTIPVCVKGDPVVSGGENRFLDVGSDEHSVKCPATGAAAGHN